MSMRASRFWPPIKHKLLYANFIVYGVTIVLLLVFHQELIWAQKTLRAYLFSGNIPPSVDSMLLQEATKSLKMGKDVKSSQQLIEQAIQIDPYSKAQLLLGICYLRQGDSDKMLACYDQYRSIDPSISAIYVNMCRILEQKQDRKAMNQLLTEGIKHLRQRVELYQPHLDPNVPKEFNRKALSIYNNSREGLNLLKKMKEELSDPNQ